jgi:hypothetical protein
LTCFQNLFAEPIEKLLRFFDCSGKLSIRALIASDAFREFNEMRQPHVDERQLLVNWFSPRAALRVRGTTLQSQHIKDMSSNQTSCIQIMLIFVCWNLV